MAGVILTQLHKRYAGTPRAGRGAVDGIDLRVPEGEFFVLFGPSGCGKTTTLRCIAGLEEPDSGAISIGRRPVYDDAAGIFVPPHRRGIGMMFQSYALWPHKTVTENVAYPLLRQQGASRTTIAGKVRETLALVGLPDLEARYPGELSGGQQQRAALARAIVAQPRLLLFDEPLSNLDAQLRQRLRTDLRRVHDETGATSLYVTHDQAEAFALADRIAVLRDGRIEQIGSARDIFGAPASRFVAEFLGYENLLGEAHAASGEVSVAGLVLRTSRGMPPGVQTGTAAFRAEALRFELGGNGAIVGRLEALTFLGDRFQVRVRVQDQILVGTLPPQGRPEVGAAVAGTIDPGNVLFLSEQPPAAARLPALAA